MVKKILAWVLGYLVVSLLAGPLLVSAQEGGRDFSQEELSQMLAPVALYPDALLSQVLMGATYPLELVEAERWLKKNPLLKGDNLDEALRDQDWDASVKALCHVPAVLGVMSERLEETTQLGDAFLSQEKEVMDTVQDLRERARREGNLKSDDKQKVTLLANGDIAIEPADPDTVYVPYYNTRQVYGPWWYPAWSPWYWGPGEMVVGSGIYFWPDFYFGFGLGFGYWSYFDWPGRTIVIKVNRRPHFFRPDYRWDSHPGSWQHEPSHRRGVVYRDRPTAERFGQPPARLEQADRQANHGKASGPVAGRGLESGKTEVLVKSAGKESGGQKNAKPLPEVDGANPAGKPDKRGGTGDIAGRQEQGKSRRDSGLAAAPAVGVSPKIEPARPVQENRDRGSEVRQEPPRTREYSTDDKGVVNQGRESQYDRQGGSGREGRQWNTRESGDVPVEERGDRGRGGRR